MNDDVTMSAVTTDEPSSVSLAESGNSVEMEIESKYHDLIMFNHTAQSLLALWFNINQANKFVFENGRRCDLFFDLYSEDILRYISERKNIVEYDHEKRGIRVNEENIRAFVSHKHLKEIVDVVNFTRDIAVFKAPLSFMYLIKPGSVLLNQDGILSRDNADILECLTYQDYDDVLTRSFNSIAHAMYDLYTLYDDAVREHRDVDGTDNGETTVSTPGVFEPTGNAALDVSPMKLGEDAPSIKLKLDPSREFTFNGNIVHPRVMETYRSCLYFYKLMFVKAICEAYEKPLSDFLNMERIADYAVVHSAYMAAMGFYEIPTKDAYANLVQKQIDLLHRCKRIFKQTLVKLFDDRVLIDKLESELKAYSSDTNNQNEHGYTRYDLPADVLSDEFIDHNNNHLSAPVHIMRILMRKMIDDESRKDVVKLIAETVSIKLNREANKSKQIQVKKDKKKIRAKMQKQSRAKNRS